MKTNLSDIRLEKQRGNYEKSKFIVVVNFIIIIYALTAFNLFKIFEIQIKLLTNYLQNYDKVTLTKHKLNIHNFEGLK